MVLPVSAVAEGFSRSNSLGLDGNGRPQQVELIRGAILDRPETEEVNGILVKSHLATAIGLKRLGKSQPLFDIGTACGITRF